MKYYYVDDYKTIINESVYQKAESDGEFDYVSVTDCIEFERDYFGFTLFCRKLPHREDMPTLNDYFYVTIHDSENDCYHVIWSFEEDSTDYLNPNFIRMYVTLGGFLKAENLRNRL